MNIQIPYGREKLEAVLPDNRVRTVLRGTLDSVQPDRSESELVRASLENPIGSKRLCELAAGKQKFVILCSDHTRPVPSRIIIPLMLEEIRRGNPAADITLLIATGCHRGTTAEELKDKFGEEVYEHERICVHDCEDTDNLIDLGVLPSGGKLLINRLAAEADLLVSEGFVEPHFFAGFSGGRKSVLPGIAAKETVYWNHNADFIHDANSRAGVLEGNPIHRDMLWAAQQAKLVFICNVIINAEHKVIASFAGDLQKAHEQAAAYLATLCEVSADKTDIVITTNNGYPLDQNLYQTVKGMCTAEAVCREGGVIIMAGACEDGIGGDGFFRTFDVPETAAEILAQIERTEKKDTVCDQWQSQIFARILAKHTVIMISSLPDDTIRRMKMIPAHSIEEAMVKADDVLGCEGSVTVIPEGISVYAK
ncbi:MAG: nickel-dependent lactate racemase [Solobacterium sp.]|nr:nickel-dependent lactate racemase [Solobacterium sp.]